MCFARCVRFVGVVLAMGVVVPCARSQGFDFVLDGVQVDGVGVTLEESFWPIPTYAVAWDLVYVVGEPSLGSQVSLALEHVPSGFTVTFDGWDDNAGDLGPDDILFGWGDLSGTFSSTGVWHFDDLIFGAQDWRLTIFDEVDDPGVDGLLYGTISVYEIPAPATVAVGVVAVALGARRRRR